MHACILDDSRRLKSEDFGQPLTMTLVTSLASLLALMLMFFSTIFIAVTTILVKSKAKVQRELHQAQVTIRRLTSVDYEEINLNVQHSNVPTQENVAYGRVSKP